MGKFFFAHQLGRSARRVKLACLLFNASAVFIDFHMASGFTLNRLHHKPHRVNVFHFAARTKTALADFANRHVDIATHRTFVHIAVTGSEIADNGTQLAQKLPGFFRRPEISLGNNLHQPNPGPVQINKSHARIQIMNRLPGILFNVNPLNADCPPAAVFRFNLKASLANQRILELSNLIPLRQIGIKIVFA